MHPARAHCRSHLFGISCAPARPWFSMMHRLRIRFLAIPISFSAAPVPFCVLQGAISLENIGLYRALANREAKIRRLVDANVLGICIWNLEGAIVEANDAFLHMLQYSRTDVVSGRLRWTDLTPAELREQDERVVVELRSIGTFQPFEKEFFRKDGSRLPVLIGGALFEENGNEGVAFVLDLTERKRVEEALKQSETRYQHVFQARSEEHTSEL